MPICVHTTYLLCLMAVCNEICSFNLSLSILEPASSSNHGLLTITILARTQWDMPHVILFVSSTRGITFKVVVCFNAYDYIRKFYQYT